MENLTKQEIDYELAKVRVQQLKKFYTSLFFFIVVFLISTFPKFYLGEIAFIKFKNVSVIFWIWGAFLTVKAARLFIFDATWEKRMIDKELKN